MTCLVLSLLFMGGCQPPEKQNQCSCRGRMRANLSVHPKSLQIYGRSYPISAPNKSNLQLPAEF